MNDILNRLNAVFCQVFRRPGLQITPASDASSINGWDSLTHIELIAAIELSFSISFSFNEVMGFNNVGDIVNCIDAHLKK
jgi:acyl carrier protein